MCPWKRDRMNAMMEGVLSWMMAVEVEGSIIVTVPGGMSNVSRVFWI